MNIRWAEILRDLQISCKCSVELIKNTTLCKLHKVSKGFRPMGSYANPISFPESALPLRTLRTTLGDAILDLLKKQSTQG